jgi:hypothetical protein
VAHQDANLLRLISADMSNARASEGSSPGLAQGLSSSTIAALSSKFTMSAWNRRPGDSYVPLPPILDICPIQLPGRENRFREAPFTQIRPIAENLARELEACLDRPYILYSSSRLCERTLRHLKLMFYQDEKPLDLRRGLATDSQVMADLPTQRTA